MSARGISYLRAPRRMIATLIGVIAAAVVLASCTSHSGPVSKSGSASGGGLPHLSVAVFQNPDSLDPGVTGLVSVAQIDNAIFDTLTYHFSGDPKTYPGLATSWSVSSDGTTYTFMLRKGVTFQDGTPFDAAAVKANFDHIANPATKSKSAIGDLGPYKETQVVNKYEVKVIFSKPNLAFKNEMSQSVFGMSSPTAMKKWGADYGKHPVGTGPFSFKSFQNNESVEVVRNPNYKWGPAKLGTGPAKLSGITFRILPDSSAQQNALRTGELQVAGDLTPQDAQAEVSSGMTKLTAGAEGMPYGYLINVAKSPTDELPVRQAIRYAVDTKSILSTLFENQFTQAKSVLTPTTPGYVPDSFNYDPDKAKQILQQAGWVTGSGDIRSKNGTQLQLALINISDFGFDQISTLVQAQLKKVGIGVTLSDQGFPAVGTTYNQGKSNLANWFYYDVDPFTLNTVFACNQIKSGFNWGHYCDKSTDAAILAANGTVSDSAREAAYKQIVTKLNDDAAFLPIYNTATILIVNHVTGISFDQTGQPYFTSATR